MRLVVPSTSIAAAGAPLPPLEAAPPLDAGGDDEARRLYAKVCPASLRPPSPLSCATPPPPNRPSHTRPTGTSTSIPVTSSDVPTASAARPPSIRLPSFAFAAAVASPAVLCSASDPLLPAALPPGRGPGPDGG